MGLVVKEGRMDSFSQYGCRSPQRLRGQVRKKLVRLLTQEAIIASANP